MDITCVKAFRQIRNFHVHLLSTACYSDKRAPKPEETIATFCLNLFCREMTDNLITKSFSLFANTKIFSLLRKMSQTIV
jgi:hypothetical protein